MDNTPTGQGGNPERRDDEAPSPYTPPPSAGGYSQPEGGQPEGGQPEGGQPTLPVYKPPPPYQPPQGNYPQQPGPPPSYQPQGQQPGYPPQYQPPAPGQQPGYPPQYQPQGYPPQGYPPQGGPPPKKGGVPVWAWVVMGLVGVMVLLCVGTVFLISRAASEVGTSFERAFSEAGVDFSNIVPVTVASSFYSSLELGNYDEARAVLGSSLARQYTTEELQRQWGALKDVEGNISAGLPSVVEADGDRTTVMVELSSNINNTYDVELVVEEIGSGDWKIVEANPELIPQP